MTEAEMWRRVAQRWVEDNRADDEYGLCYSVECVVEDDPNIESRNKMVNGAHQRLQLFNDGDNYYRYFWSENGAHDERALAACLLAAMAEDES